MLTLLPFLGSCLAGAIHDSLFLFLCDFCTPHELGLSRELLALLLNNDLSGFQHCHMLNLSPVHTAHQHLPSDTDKYCVLRSTLAL